MSLLLKLPSEVLDDVNDALPVTGVLPLRATCTELHALTQANAQRLSAQDTLELRGRHSLKIVLTMQNANAKLTRQHLLASHQRVREIVLEMETQLQSLTSEIDSTQEQLSASLQRELEMMNCWSTYRMMKLRSR